MASTSGKCQKMPKGNSTFKGTQELWSSGARRTAITEKRESLRVRWWSQVGMDLGTFVTLGGDWGSCGQAEGPAGERDTGKAFCSHLWGVRNLALNTVKCSGTCWVSVPGRGLEGSAELSWKTGWTSLVLLMLWEQKHTEQKGGVCQYVNVHPSKTSHKAWSCAHTNIRTPTSASVTQPPSLLSDSRDLCVTNSSLL